jgi:Fe-S-cluster containining protein
MLGAMRLSRDQQHRDTTATFERTAAELAARGDAGAGSALCRRLNDDIDRKIAELRADGAAVACEAGCNYCCHLRVTVFAHEAAALHAYLTTQASRDEGAAIERRIRENARRIDGMSAAQHRSAGIPCAFLREDGLCSAHAVRPSACAAYHSVDRARCEHAFRHPEAIGTEANSRPVLLELQVFGSAQIEATNAARIAAGLPGGQQELHQALRALLDAEAGRAARTESEL